MPRRWAQARAETFPTGRRSGASFFRKQRAQKQKGEIQPVNPPLQARYAPYRGAMRICLNHARSPSATRPMRPAAYVPSRICTVASPAYAVMQSPCMRTRSVSQSPCRLLSGAMASRTGAWPSTRSISSPNLGDSAATYPCIRYLRAPTLPARSISPAHSPPGMRISTDVSASTQRRPRITALHPHSGRQQPSR